MTLMQYKKRTNVYVVDGPRLIDLDFRCNVLYCMEGQKAMHEPPQLHVYTVAIDRSAQRRSSQPNIITVHTRQHV